MLHLVVVDANDVSLNVMSRALSLGYHVSLLNPRTFRWYSKGAFSIDLLRRATRVISIESAGDEAEVTNALLGINAEEPINGVVNAVDATIEATAAACEAAGIRFTPSKAVKNSRNKLSTRRVLASAGLSTPRFAHATTMESVLAGVAECGLPAIMKPVSGFSSLMTYRVNDYADAVRAAGELLRADEMVPAVLQRSFSRGILIEEYLPGTLVAAEIAVLDQRFFRLMITGRGVAEHNECCGMGSILPAGISPKEEKISFDYAEAVCSVLGLDFGVFDLEIMLTQSGPVLIEANPRMMGGIMPTAYWFATGVSFEDVVLGVYTGTFVEEPIVNAQYAVIQKLIPSVDSVLASNIDLDTILNKHDCAFFANHLIRCSREVNTGDIIGRFIVCDNKLADAMEKSSLLLTFCEEALGVKLIRPIANDGTHTHLS